MKKLFQIITTLMASSLFPFFVQAQTSINPINQNFTPEALALLGSSTEQTVSQKPDYASGDYRAAKSGAWTDLSTWEVYDATKKSWHPAEVVPSLHHYNVVHLPDGITVSVKHHASCYELNLYGNGSSISTKHSYVRAIRITQYSAMQM